MPILCPTCNNPAPDDARFCEHDGTQLIPDEPLASDLVSAAPTVEHCKCGATEAAKIDGFCEQCGRKWVDVSVSLAVDSDPRDHIELALSDTIGGVTDRGIRHKENQDDFGVALSASDPPLCILVVCDGVSASNGAQQASESGVKAACEHLLAATNGDFTDHEAVMTAAIAASDHAVRNLGSSLPADDSHEPPESTLVAAVVGNDSALIGWIGDSRAYWIEPDNPQASQMLTQDHSWLNDVVASGEMSEAEAETNRLAHALIRCLGAPLDSPDVNLPSVINIPIPLTDGLLLLCSDGLWNYAHSAVQIAELTAQANSEGAKNAVEIAAWLCRWANTQGGKDNVSVAVCRVNKARLGALNKVSESEI